MASAINAKDPSGLRATEDRRAKEMQKDLDSASQRALDRVIDGNVTDPTHIQSIVDSELKNYSDATKLKTIGWIKDTWRRSDYRAQSLIKAEGGKIIITPHLGPSGTLPLRVSNAVEINVQNNIDSLSASLKTKVTSSIISGMTAGVGPRVIAKNISEATGMERSRAMLIARTETMRANNDAAKARYDQYGVKQVRWFAALDDRVCDVCGEGGGYHEQVFDIDDAPEIPAHPNCRCVLLPEITDDD